jgi:RNA polymerase sigma-70 factor, ECF subfamily
MNTEPTHQPPPWLPDDLLPEDTPDEEPSPQTLEAVAADRRYHNLVRGILWRHFVRVNDMDDVHQEVFIALMKCLPRIGPVRSMRALLTNLAKWQAADYHRSQARRGPVMEHDEDGVAGAPGAGVGALPPDRAFAVIVLQRIARAILAKMAPDLREVFVLMDVEGNTAPEAAEILGVPLTTAKWRIRKARKTFLELRAPFLADIS